MNVHKFNKIVEYVNSFITIDKLSGNNDFLVFINGRIISLHKAHVFPSISLIRIIGVKNVEMLVYHDKETKLNRISREKVEKISLDLGIFPVKSRRSINSYSKFHFDSIEESKLFFNSLLVEESINGN